MNIEQNPHARFGFEHSFLFDGTWQVKGEPDPYIHGVIAFINVLGFTLQREGISPRRLRIAPFPDFSYRVVPHTDTVFILLGESGSRTTRYAIFEDRWEGPEPGREALLKECEEVLGWDHCLGVPFPFSALTARDQLNHAAEHAAQEVAAHLIGVMQDKQAREQIAKTSQTAQTLLALIADDDLRQRCEDILSAEKHYDRVIREACVILEHRVRQASGADTHLVGTTLMEHAFNPKNGALRLSTYEPEQRGAMHLYLGVMAFFRNPAGHQIANDTYTQNDALRFVLWVDVLLKMVSTASTTEEPRRPCLQADHSVPPQYAAMPDAPSTGMTAHTQTSSSALLPIPQATPTPPVKKPMTTKKKKKPASTVTPAPTSTPKMQGTPKKKANVTKAANALSASPTPVHAIQKTDRQQMISCLVQTYKEAVKSYPNGWVPLPAFGSRLLLAYPSFKEQFHPKMRLPTFLKQQQDIFQTQKKGKHLEVRMLESSQ